MKDYYKILGVDKNASQDEIKKAYRKLSKQYHPDTSQGDDTKFKEIQEAYSILSDEQKRKEYDNPNPFSGSGNPFASTGGDPFGGFNVRFTWGGGTDTWEDIFTTFGMGGSQRKRKGKDIKIEVRLDFIDVFTGKSMNIPITRRENEHGVIVEKKRTFKLNIQKGFNPNKPIVLKGEGHHGMNGGKAGDIKIYPRLKAHPFFQYDGYNLLCTITINFTQALLGDTIFIKNIDGENIKTSIPEGIKDGQSFVIKNKGFPIAENTRGDMIIRVHIEYPKQLNEKQKELVASLHSTFDTTKKFG